MLLAWAGNSPLRVKIIETGVILLPTYWPGSYIYGLFTGINRSLESSMLAKSNSLPCDTSKGSSKVSYSSILVSVYVLSSHFVIWNCSSEF